MSAFRQIFCRGTSEFALIDEDGNIASAPENVDEDSTFESLGVDSLDMVELICELEERLDVDFGEPEGLETMSDLVEYVDSL